MNDQRVSGLVEHLFRRQAGVIQARLTRIFGPRHLDLAEEVVQDALLAALRSWPFNGIPENPQAWLLRVARNRALDRLRRRSLFGQKQEDIQHQVRRLAEINLTVPAAFEREILDDQLQLMFLCCHPSLSAASSVALILKVIGGFGVAEISRALLSSPVAISRRLSRAKNVLRQEGSFELPSGEDLPPRLQLVLAALYLMFNEGYAAHQGEQLIRADICQEALRLVTILVNNPQTASPEVDALAALMWLHSGRLPARQGDSGQLTPLAAQDRASWDWKKIEIGFRHLSRSLDGPEESRFHLEALIAASHASAPSFEETNWVEILHLYDRLTELNPSPVVALNRCVAVGQVEDASAALECLDELREVAQLKDYYLLHATIGAFELQRGHAELAEEAYRRALECRCSQPEQHFLQQRLAECCRTPSPTSQ